MKYNPFSPKLIKKIYHQMEIKKTQNSPLIAAFDADGTLWDTDVGESFFNFLIKHQKIPLPQNPWEHYEQLKKKDHLTAYFWLAEILAPHSIEDVRGWAKEHIHQHPPSFYPAQKQLISDLLSYGVQIYIITASITWAIEPAVEFCFNLPPSTVLGIETELDQNKVTTKWIQPGPYREGKRVVLLKKTKGITPFFACGNTLGDLQLLETADLPLAVRSSGMAQKELKQSENDLRNIALQKGWDTHDFVTF